MDHRHGGRWSSLRDLPLDIKSWELPSDADIVMLNDRASVGAVRKTGRDFSYGDVAGGAGTEGYLISQGGAAKLLRVLYPLMNPLDFQMYAHFESIQRLDCPPHYWKLPMNPRAVRTSLKAYRVMPGLVSHTGAESSIGNQRHPHAHVYCKLLLGMDFGLDRFASPVSCRHWAAVPRAAGISSCRQWMGLFPTHSELKVPAVSGKAVQAHSHGGMQGTGG